MKVVFGMGNPGREYARTRHNLGFMVADELARRHAGSWKKTGASLVAGVRILGRRVLLAKPQTYVNSCGIAAREILECGGAHDASTSPSDGGAGVEDFLVVVDDANLEPGKLRLRRSGASGGHNGLESLIAELGTEEFCRLKIGIGAPREGDLIDHVLDEFDEGEWEAAKRAVLAASDATEVWAELGTNECMNRYN